MTLLLQTLIIIQICMGAFDTLYHHEFTERLAWRPSQKGEVRLHGIRNILYAGLFMVIGCLEVKGGFAVAIGVLLVIELGITLVDFVEEDMTRKLPASERVTHTLMALNYGAILVLLAPVLVDWAQSPASIAAVSYGLWSGVMGVAAVTVGVFGVRDLFAAKRLERLAAAPRDRLLAEAAKPQSVLITGGTGFIGTRLVEALVESGHRVTVLTRKFESAAHLATPLRVITDLDQIHAGEHFDTVINLAGAPTAGWLWTESYKEKILNSRLDMTRGLVAMMARMETLPTCFISGSAIGAYGVEASAPTIEAMPIVADESFAQRLCLEWEAEAIRAEALGIRTVLLRTGIVLDTAGGPLGQMLFPFEFGLGGPFGKGDHWMSWITRDDLVRLIAHAMETEAIAGPLNGTAPEPVTNRTYAKALGRALKRPAILAIPEFVLRKGLGELGTDIFLASQNIVPARAVETGFRFDTATIEEAFAEIFKIAKPNQPLHTAHEKTPTG